MFIIGPCGIAGVIVKLITGHRWEITNGRIILFNSIIGSVGGLRVILSAAKNPRATRDSSLRSE